MQHNEYLRKLARFHQLADVLQIEPALLIRLLNRLRTINKRREIEAYSRSKAKST
jgi:hypothetical protein